MARRAPGTDPEFPPPKDSAPGRKDDQGKPTIAYLLSISPFMYRALSDVAKALELGGKDYGKTNFFKVERIRFTEAELRHIAESEMGVTSDHKTGLHPDAHAACNALIRLAKYYFDRDNE